MGGRLARFAVVAVSGTETVGAAVRSMGFEGRGPSGRPDQQNREETERCRQFLSRSDRKVQRWAHLDTS
jgi:hypothetical protein